jgi:hypothetical protein
MEPLIIVWFSPSGVDTMNDAGLLQQLTSFRGKQFFVSIGPTTHQRLYQAMTSDADSRIEQILTNGQIKLAVADHPTPADVVAAVRTQLSQ